MKYLYLGLGNMAMGMGRMPQPQPMAMPEQNASVNALQTALATIVAASGALNNQMQERID